MWRESDPLLPSLHASRPRRRNSLKKRCARHCGDWAVWQLLLGGVATFLTAYFLVVLISRGLLSPMQDVSDAAVVMFAKADPPEVQPAAQPYSPDPIAVPDTPPSYPAILHPGAGPAHLAGVKPVAQGPRNDESDEEEDDDEDLLTPPARLPVGAGPANQAGVNHNPGGKIGDSEGLPVSENPHNQEFHHVYDERPPGATPPSWESRYRVRYYQHEHNRNPPQPPSRL
eukprot:g77424.t1